VIQNDAPSLPYGKGRKTGISNGEEEKDDGEKRIARKVQIMRGRHAFSMILISMTEF